jgi:hypothetical protein
MNSAQKIVLRRLRKVAAPQRIGETRPEFVASLIKNLESIGFTLSAEVIERLLTWTPEELLAFAESLIPALLKMVGGDVKYAPMYPNFPTQVMEASEAELYLNAIYHYLGDWVGERILPYYDKQQRPKLRIQKDLKALELASDEEALDLCRALIGSNTSLSNSDQKDLRGLLEACREEVQSVLPESIPFKEVQSVVCAFLIDRVEDSAATVARYLRTATDVLRLATEMSGGDSSLAAPTKYISFKRKQRRVILDVLNRIKRPDEDLNRHRVKWIRLAERLHPGEYSKRFPNAFAAIKKLRDGEKPETFNSKIEQFLRLGDSVGAMELLKTRPGDFARRVDHLLRISEKDSGAVLDAFRLAANDVSTPVLLQLISHFKQRALDQNPRTLKDVPENESLQFFEKAVKSLTKPLQKKTAVLEPTRTVFPKGQTSKLIRIPLAKELIAPALANGVVQICEDALVSRFAQLPPLGKSFVAPELANFMVPFSQRSASKSLRTLARGSRMQLPDSNVIRFFLWWKEGKISGKQTGRVDLDLSATVFRSNWKYLNHISYTNLKEAKLGCCHSGDITSAPKGASEFIDIDIEKTLAAGGRYVMCSIQSYTSNPFCDLPQCYVGWMSRKNPGSGEIYEPATVRDKIDLASDSRISIPMLIDLKDRTAIWADLALRSMPNYHINIESNLRGLVHYGIGIETMIKPNLQELFSLHVLARGESVDSVDEAESVFSASDGVTPFDFETIASEYLA